MARLSEPPTAPAAVLPSTTTNPADPPSIETLEAVKRNLIRQNRSLARANSQQSLQIRTLGAEVSRLLTVNLGLKEELITSRNELRVARQNDRADGFQGLKRAMAVHLQEMTAMLNCMQDSASDQHSPQPSPETRKSMCMESMEFRERPSLKEIMAQSRMPTIRENRVYPRIPIPQLELSPESCIKNASGHEPPETELTIAHLNELEAVTTEETSREGQPTADGSGDLPACDTVNIETRRRRKLSSSGVLSRRGSNLASSSLDNDTQSTIFRTGAKRKLADRDENISTQPIKDAKRSPGRKAAQLGDVDESAPLLPKSRKALSEKSINHSPRKLRRVEDDEQSNKATKTSLPRQRKVVQIVPFREVDVINTKTVMPMKEDGVTEDMVKAELTIPPFTPLPADILSPLSSERSFVSHGKVDTPPPMDLSIMSSTTSNEGARPSRRARAAVNYAEPSLVAKMRRPSKAMVDALTGLQDPRRAMSTSTERRTSSADDAEHPLMPDLQTQLAQEEDEAELCSQAVETEHERPPTALSIQRSTHTDVPASTTSLELSSLMATGKARQARNAREGEMVVDLAIFDFDDTSSTSSPASAAVGMEKEPVKMQRRHSSVAKGMTKAAEGGKSHAAIDASSRSTSVGNRRRSMMI